MSKAIVLKSLSVLCLLLPVGNAIAAEPSDRPARQAITLPLELKDPFTAYSLGLVPFGSLTAAHYVGTTRLSSEIPNSVAADGTIQLLTDVALLTAGTALTVLAPNNPGLNLAGVVSLVAIPASHFFMYSNHWSAVAANFNKKRMLQFGFVETANEELAYPINVNAVKYQRP